MSFKANHDAIRAFSEKLSALIDDADRANAYAKDALSIGYKEGRMFFTVVETATTVRDALTANYNHLAKLIDAAAAESAEAATSYDNTDQASAARIDSTY